MKIKINIISTSIFVFSVFLTITSLDACKIPKIVNNRTICFYTHNSWSAENNSVALKIDSINGIWHYLTYIKKGTTPYMLKSFLKGDHLECNNWVEDTHWSISCKGHSIEILDHKSQSAFTLKNQIER